MGWCSWGDADSDVLVYETVERSGSATLVCCHGADHFVDHDDFRAKRYSELLAHLQDHVDAGLKVPARVVAAITAEREDLGDVVRTARERARASAGKSSHVARGERRARARGRP